MEVSDDPKVSREFGAVPFTRRVGIEDEDGRRDDDGTPVVPKELADDAIEQNLPKSALSKKTRKKTLDDPNQLDGSRRYSEHNQEKETNDISEIIRYIVYQSKR